METGSAIALPKGGGAISGIGEKFAASAQTGTAAFTVPIALPPGRNGLTPTLSLSYGSGSGNGEFGLGWSLSLPGVSRKTARGVPRYTDADVFLLSGAEDLIPLSGTDPGRVRYRPRTEGEFARIEHVRGASGDYWETRDIHGMVTRFGTPKPAGAGDTWRDPAATVRPGGGVFVWKVTQTVDPLGNLVRYSYHSDPPLLERIEYADYGPRTAPSFLVGVEFEYEPRPDAFSDHRAGFEVRSTLRCRLIRVYTRAADGVVRTLREYRLGYETAPFNGVSLLTRIEPVGIADGAEEPLPPLTFTYTGFDPSGRRFAPLPGDELALLLGDPNVAMVDLRGSGLPDLVEVGGTHRIWANRGGGRFDALGRMAQAPPHSLSDDGVRLLDADGDGRADLLAGGGYFPMTFGGGWSGRSFVPYRQLPGVSLADPAVKLVDLDGDGLTDVLRSGERLECWFNDRDPRLAWQRRSIVNGPGVDLADPRVRLADMTGDGLQDIVLLHNGSVSYWPNLGHGRWGAQVHMRQSPRLPHDDFNPRRLLLGDVDGDGAADLVYVEDGRITLWGNRCGNGWSRPVTITGTPRVVDTDSVQFADLHGSGMSGLLWVRPTDGKARFLDLCGGVKPYLLSVMDNGVGARTTVTYRPSTHDFLRDEAAAATRWRTPLPFPTQLVARVEVDDLISSGRLVTEYRYHHGYWDGHEREFRGFAMVEQLDTETFETPEAHYSPPTLTKTWFSVGFGLDLTHEYWEEDPPVFTPPTGLSRDALRAMRGRPLRTELYALDGSARQDRPYTVTETLTSVRQEADHPRVFFPFEAATRTTQWERGDEPMTRFTFTTGYDAYGQPTKRLDVAMPRETGEPYLATLTTTQYAQRDDAQLLMADRPARKTGHEVVNDGAMSVFGLRDAVFAGTAQLRVIADARTYYDGPAFAGLPLGQLGAHGLPVRAESLAFTDGFLENTPPYLDPAGPVWTADYPQEFRTLTPQLAGYAHHDGGYYVTDSRLRYDVHDPARTPRGLVLSTMDPLGALTQIEYDAHDLFPVRTTDPLGLRTEVLHDYRTLMPKQLTDVNGNSKSVTFSPAGYVTATFVRGKGGQGDVAAPSVEAEYDLLAFVQRQQPLSVRTTRRVLHDPDSEVIVSVEYSDGFGRLLQTRTQAEDTLFGDAAFGGGVLPVDQTLPVGPAPSRTRNPGDPPNVVVSGWQVYDNKGRIVHKYEPFFSTGFGFAAPDEAELGRKVIMRYDPRGQLIRRVSPDGSEQRVVLGVPVDLADPDTFAPTPWEVYTYDANDNAGRTHHTESQPYAGHWNTPASVTLDALGRTVVAVARNGQELVVATSTYDIQGNVTSVTDALGRESLRYKHDLRNRQWRCDGIDAGRRDTVHDGLGRVVESRDAKGALTLAAFDIAQRPIRGWARDGAADAVTLRQRLEYGDGSDPGQPPAERDAARAQNLLGRVVRHYDGAGLVAITDVDFKGNVLESARWAIADAPILAVYAQAAANGWQVTPFRVDWTQPAAQLLEPVAYHTSTRFDALSRVTLQILPADVEAQRREVRPEYNRAGGLERVLLGDDVYVDRIAYDAKGQRTLIAYGNGVATRYAYDPDTFRLARMRTERGATVIQDCRYDYDVAGNLLTIRDRTPGSGLPLTPGALDRQFAYDPIYRLLSAIGRESDTVPHSPPWTVGPHHADVTLTRAYTESYTYDVNNNLLRMVHSSAGGGFTRDYAAEPGSNRLRRMTIGATQFDYAHDANGNLLSETTSRHFTWDHSDRLHTFATQTAGAEPSVHAHYLYDANGQRVKKLVRRQGGGVEVTHYIGGLEHHRWGTGPLAQNNHIHVMDGEARIALARIGPARPGDQTPAVAFQLADHLGSSTVVVDAAGQITNREEYTPYGETSFGSYTRKRYRFTGKERDEESGLGYHGARYCLTWLARWASCDPIHLSPSDTVKGTHESLYVYAANNPLKYNDPDGRNPETPKPPPEPRTPIASGPERRTPIASGPDRTPIASGGGGQTRTPVATSGTVGKAPLFPPGSRGTMDARGIRFVQDSVDDTFQDGRKISQLVKELENPAKAAQVEPVKVFRDRGLWFTLDHRRVIAFQKANVPVPYVVASGADIAEAKEAGKFTTDNDGVSIKIRSEGKPASAWETHRVPNPGTPNGTISMLSRANRGLLGMVGFPVAPPPPGVNSTLYKSAGFMGGVLNVLSIFGGLKADYDHYIGGGKDEPKEPNRKVIMTWPFPGFVFTPHQEPEII